MLPGASLKAYLQGTSKKVPRRVGGKDTALFDSTLALKTIGYNAIKLYTNSHVFMEADNEFECHRWTNAPVFYTDCRKPLPD